MSTRETDIESDLETPQRVPGSLYTENTAQQEKLPPMGNFPQPPQRPPRSKRSYWFAVAAVIVVVALIFGVYALVVSQQSIPAPRSHRRQRHLGPLSQQPLGAIPRPPHQRASPLGHRTARLQ